MTYTREALEALDKDTLITMLLRQREVAGAGNDNFDYGVAELKAEIAKLTEQRDALEQEVHSFWSSKTARR